MQLNRGAEGGGRGCGAPPDGKQLRCRERELVAQLHELLFPSPPPPSAAGGSMSWSSSSLSADLFVERCSLPVEAPASCGKRRGRGSKRVREGHPQEEQKQRGGGCSTATKAARSRRRKEGTPTTTIVTTVPDFDGYQWKKYGQKQIEAAKYPRSYYRCTNSMDQACPAKRTVQRNEDGDGDGGQPKYTVVYISEHSCKTAEAVAAPVILETTARTKSLAAPDDAAVFASSSSAASTGTQSPATSDITWSGCTVAGANPTPTEFAADSDCWEWDPSPAAPAVAAAALLQEMDFARPIMSPVHVAATDGSWINDLFVNESLFVLNSSQLFGF
uniref:Uncharacterized protein n=1 Tax=Avena sativa TaxID=4498 RepID=A0ACD5YHW2_AVESA